MHRTVTEAELLTTTPNTLEVTADGIQPTMLEVTVSQTLTLLNNDTRTRRLRLSDASVVLGYKVYLPLIMRATSNLLFTPIAFNLDRLAAPIGTEIITLNAGESVARTFMTVGNRYVSDADTPTIPAATLLVTPLPLPKIGSVTGLVRDYQTKAPIIGANITTIESPTLQTISDALGNYVLPLPPGAYTLVVFANGYTFANRKVTVQSFTPTGVEPLELVPLDPVVVPISAAGGVVTNSLGTTSIVVSPGAVTSTKAIRLTQLPVDAAVQNLSALPGPFVNGEMPLGFVAFEPDGTVFSAPVTWTIAYTGELPVGYPVPCYYWLEQEARWGQPVNGHVVDLGNGHKGLQAVLPHFSDYGFAPPPPPPDLGSPGSPKPGDPNDPSDGSGCPKGDSPCGSLLNFISGGLSQEISTLGLPNGGGSPTQITARYRSINMAAAAKIDTAFTGSGGDQYRTSTLWTFDIAGQTFGGSGKVVAVTWDKRDGNGQLLPPGVIDGVLAASWRYQYSWLICSPIDFTCKYVNFDNTFTSSTLWPVSVRRADLSPFGLGWFSRQDTLLINYGGRVSIMQADGRQVGFTPTANGYVPQSGDFGTLIHNADGTWTRTTPDGTTLTFNADGRLTQIADRYGNAQIVLYESNGRTFPAGSWGLTTRIRRVTDTSGNTFDYAYDANGWLATISDSAGRIYHYEHDAAGHLTASIDPLGERETFAYDARGLMTRHTDQRGSATTYALDDQGRLITRTWPTSTMLQMSYTPTRTTVLNDRGAQWTTTLDANFDAVARYNGVYTQTTLFADHLPQFTTTPPQTTLYDASGNAIESLTATQAQFERNGPFDQVTRATATDGTDTRLTYDAAGNVTSSTDALNRTYQLTYDAHGQPLSITDPLGKVMTQQYNARGQIISTTDPLSRTTQVAYNAAGALTRIEDPLGRVTTIRPDALNRPIVITDALNGHSTMQYDAAGNLIKVIDPTSRAMMYTYDALNRVTGIQSPDGGLQSLAYDALGNLTRTVDARGQTIGYQYDAHNRLINRSVQNGATTTYAYDNLDQVIGRAGGVLNTTINYVPDSVDYPLNVQRRSATLPLSATLKYDYGLGYGNGGVDVPELNLNLTPPVKNVGAQATPYILPAPPTRFVGTGTPGSCTDLALATALSGGGVIGFDCGVNPVTITLSAVKVITAPTTVDGGNLVALDGNNAVGLFSVTNGAALTVTNLTLMRAKCRFCGAIEVQAGAHLTSVNAVFTANQWGGWSGVAIYVYGTADVISTTFTNNANYDDGGGPAPIVLLAQSGDPTRALTVTHSLFKGNLTGGIGMDGNARLNVADTVFDQNTGYQSGAIGVSSGAATIDDAVFVDNRALNNNLNVGNGGAIYSNGMVTVTQSWFISNTTTGSGGAIDSANGLASIAASTFMSNSAATSGGAILNPGQVRNSVFVNNRASDSGALYAGGLVSITASVFVSNAATSGGGGAITLYNPLTVITGTTLLSNTATGNGGGLAISYYASSGSIQLSNVDIVGNTAGAQGGGLYVATSGNNVTLNIAHLTAANNRTLNGSGGGVWISALGLMLSDSLFSNNLANGAGQTGGGLYTYNNAANATISRTVFFHNQSSDPAQCGGWYAAGLNNVISHSSFTGNSGLALCTLSPLTATLNYWGAATGPYHATLNPTGQGDKVGNGVLFTPWNPAFFFPGDGRMHGLQLTTNANPVQTVRLTHDAVGQLASLSSRGYATYTLNYLTDADGRLIERSPIATAPLTNVYEYDAANQLTRLAISSPGGPLLSEAYAYDAAGNLTQTTSSRDGVSIYAYDALNRLIGVSSPDFNAAYGYDAVGNRTSAGGVTYTYDAGGRLISASDGTTYNYDAAGNLIKRIQSGQTMTLTWDTQSRLTRIDYSNGTYSAYQYDAVGRRISKRLPDGTLIYYVYIGDDLAQELDGSGAVIASYTYDGLDRPISLWRRTNGANGATYYYQLDHLGSVLGLTDATGNVVATYRYDPWGTVISSTGTITNPLRFTAREYDAESGLYFYRARYYDPQTGRFISRDPIGLKNGFAVYAYVKNNPTRYSDPLGTFIPPPTVGIPVSQPTPSDPEPPDGAAPPHESDGCWQDPGGTFGGIGKGDGMQDPGDTLGSKGRGDGMQDPGKTFNGQGHGSGMQDPNDTFNGQGRDPGWEDADQTLAGMSG
jgi:RHS repeat-associated protein